MKLFTTFILLLSFGDTSVFWQNREQTAYKFCQDVMSSKKSYDQIISDYIVVARDPNADISTRNSLINIQLKNLRENNKINNSKDIKVVPYSQSPPIPGLEGNFRTADIYAVYNGSTPLIYILFEEDRIASFTVLKKGVRSYFLLLN